jgi:arginyl-tRNA synthetase
MVELAEGKMKSREGTVVDADDLIDEMVETARKTTLELGKAGEFDEAEAGELFYNIGMGALKYFLLKVDPKKKMMFNPKESIDFNGNTGPFIQYTHARIRSVVRKSAENSLEPSVAYEGALNGKERDLMKFILAFPEAVRQAGEQFSPAVIANYAFDLAKEYNSFYHENSILKEEDKARAAMRLALSVKTAAVLSSAMLLLGIKVPERM